MQEKVEEKYIKKMLNKEPLHRRWWVDRVKIWWFITWELLFNSRVRVIGGDRPRNLTFTNLEEKVTLFGVKSDKLKKLIY